MLNRLTPLFVFVLLLSGCAQVPQSSVVLSNSIADDLTSMQDSHKSFVNFYFDNLEQKANDLIDKQYRPSLIKELISIQVSKYQNPAKKNQSLFNAIQIAFVDNSNLNQAELETAQSNAMAGMQIFYSKIDEKVESERQGLLAPIEKQRSELLNKIDTNYINIIKKNSAITALLNSIVDLHESQQQLFNLADIDTNIREDVGNKLSDLSNQITGSTNELKDIEDKINKFKTIINE